MLKKSYDLFQTPAGAPPAAVYPAAGFAADLSGLPVTAIILKDDLGKPLPDVDSLLPLIEVKPGDLFSNQAVRKGIGYLYLEGSSGRPGGSLPRGGGVRLEYTFVPVILVERIVLRGTGSSRITPSVTRRGDRRKGASRGHVPRYPDEHPDPLRSGGILQRAGELPA